MLKWVLAIVAGGGTAGVVQTGSVLVRGASLGTTGGLGNPLVSLGELVMSGLFTVLAIVVPFVAVGLLALALVVVARRRRRARVAG